MYISIYLYIFLLYILLCDALLSIMHIEFAHYKIKLLLLSCVLYFHFTILKMILISSLHCSTLIPEGNFDPELLRQNVFNPFFDDPEISYLLLNCNLDPNPNIFTSNSELLSHCIYLTSSEFNKTPFHSDAFCAV